MKFITVALVVQFLIPFALFKLYKSKVTSLACIHKGMGYKV